MRYATLDTMISVYQHKVYYYNY